MILKGTDHILVQEAGLQSEQEDRPKMDNILLEVRRKLVVAAEKGKRSYNLRRRSEQFYVNQLVWKKNFVQSDAARYYSQKLAPKYVGPFLVKKRISPWTYELADTNGNTRGVWHAKDLKPVSSKERLQGNPL